VGKTTLIKSLVKHYTRHNLSSVKGPITVVSGKQRRLQLVECGPELSNMARSRARTGTAAASKRARLTLTPRITRAPARLTPPSLRTWCCSSWTATSALRWRPSSSSTSSRHARRAPRRLHRCARLPVADSARQTHQVHGFPKVMGVLTHLDEFTDASKLKKVKKTLKVR
jgi:hypothetical protein